MMAETAAAGRGETAPRAALARVEREEEAAPLGMGLVAGKRAVATGAVTLERFDLDDIGPQSRQEPAAVRGRDELSQLDDPEAGERARIPFAHRHILDPAHVRARALPAQPTGGGIGRGAEPPSEQDHAVRRGRTSVAWPA